MLSDTDGIIHWVNHKFLEITSQTRDQIIGQKILKFLFENKIDEKKKNIIQNQLQNRQSFTSEIQIINENQQCIWIKINANPFDNSQQTWGGYLWNIEDITESKKQKEIIENAHNLLELTSSMTGIGGWEVDLETMTPMWSKEVYRIHEVPFDFQPNLEEAINFYAPEHQPIITAAVQRGLETGEGWDLELDFITAKGNKLRVRAIGNIVFKDGKAVKMYGAFQDITEQYTNELNKNKVSDRLKLVTENARIGVWDWDIANNDLVWDDMMYSIYKLRKMIFSGAYEAWESVVHPQDLEKASQDIQDAIDGKKDFNTSFRILWPDGEERSIRAIATIYRDNQGQAIRMIGTNWDNTSEVKSYHTRKITTERLEQVTHSARIGIWDWDIENNSLFWNDVQKEIMNLDKDVEPNYDIFMSKVHPDDRELVNKATGDALNNISEFNIRFRLLLDHGVTKHLRGIGNVIRNSYGKPIRMLGTNWDITQELFAEEEMRLITERLGHVTENAKIGVWDWDLKNGTIFLDNILQSIFSITVKDHQSPYDAWKALVHHEDVEIFDENFNDALNNALPYNTTFRIINPKNNEVQYIKSIAKVFRNSQGEATRMLGVAWDDTIQNEKEQCLAKALEDAKIGLETQSRFLAMISHEIRTPLNGIIGSLQLFQDEELKPTQNELLETLLDSSDSLMHTINDIIDIAKVRAGKIKLHSESFNFERLGNSITLIYQQIAKDKDLDFIFNMDKTVPSWIKGDKQRLRQIINNLLNNAIKFTEDGYIKLNFTTAKEQLIIEVIDTGIGIPIRKQQSIFEDFTQVDNYLQRSHGGSGLGLSICRQLAYLMKGKIEYLNNDPEGSIFKLSIPLIIASSTDTVKTETIEHKIDLEHLNVLIAEDNPINQKVLQKMLKKNNIQNITLSSDGLQALEYFKKSSYDIVLMDIQMPNMDGIESMLKMREHSTDKKIPIIAVTANAMEGDRNLYLEKGFNEVIAKPIKSDDLLNKIKEIMSKF